MFYLIERNIVKLKSLPCAVGIVAINITLMKILKFDYFFLFLINFLKHKPLLHLFDDFSFILINSCFLRLFYKRGFSNHFKNSQFYKTVFSRTVTILICIHYMPLYFLFFLLHCRFVQEVAIL